MQTAMEVAFARQKERVEKVQVRYREPRTIQRCVMKGKTGSGQRRWSEDEEELMRKFYLDVGPEDVAHTLERSVAVVRAKACRMGLLLRPRKGD